MEGHLWLLQRRHPDEHGCHTAVVDPASEPTEVTAGDATAEAAAQQAMLVALAVDARRCPGALLADGRLGRRRPPRSHHPPPFRHRPHGVPRRWRCVDGGVADARPGVRAGRRAGRRVLWPPNTEPTPPATRSKPSCPPPDRPALVSITDRATRCSQEQARTPYEHASRCRDKPAVPDHGGSGLSRVIWTATTIVARICIPSRLAAADDRSDARPNHVARRDM